MDDDLIIRMYECSRKNAKLTFKDDSVATGFVDTYESRGDNDGVASICFASDDGRMLIVDEVDLIDIEPLE